MQKTICNLQSSIRNPMNLPETDPNQRVETSHIRAAEIDDYERAYRYPSASTYIAVVASAAVALFFLVWFILHAGGDEAPWIPAGLAASIAFLVALAAREVILRRALTRHILEKERRDYRVADFQRKRKSVSLDYYTSKLRSIIKHSAAADSKGEHPELHLEVYQSCRDYLHKVEDALRTARAGSQSLIALRAGQERVRGLQKHHLLQWASIASREWTNEAQKRVQPKEKLEAAQKALEVIESALKIYPEEQQLLASAHAMKDHMASLRVAQWIERAERDTFKGRFRRAIERYNDALFYLSREEMSEELREQIGEHIFNELQNLRERLREKKELGKQDANADFEERSLDDLDLEEDDFADDDFSGKERRTDIN